MEHNNVKGQVDVANSATFSLNDDNPPAPPGGVATFDQGTVIFVSSVCSGSRSSAVHCLLARFAAQQSAVHCLMLQFAAQQYTAFCCALQLSRAAGACMCQTL